MKVHVRQTLVKIIFTSLFLVLLYYPAQKHIQDITQRLNKNKQTLAIKAQKKAKGFQCA